MLHHRSGRSAEGNRDEFNWMPECDVHKRLTRLKLIRGRAIRVIAMVIFDCPRWIDAVPAQEVIDEGAMFKRISGCEITTGHAALYPDR